MSAAVSMPADVGCPKCEGRGEVINIEATGAMTKCSLCRGRKRVAARIATAWTSEQGRED